MQIAESTAGTNTYGITCTGAPPAAKAQVTVSFTPDSPSSGSTRPSGHGGGGALDGLSLLILSLGVLRQLGLPARSASASPDFLARPPDDELFEAYESIPFGIGLFEVEQAFPLSHIVFELQ